MELLQSVDVVHFEVVLTSALLFPFNWNNPAANVLIGEGAFVRCQVDELI